MLKSKQIRPGYIPRYFDVAVNLCDDMFKGKYRDNQHHESDSNSVLRRARLLNVDRILLTGSSYQESRWSIDEARRINAIGDVTQYPQLYTTVGVHPCTVLEFEPDPESHLDKIRRLIKENLQDGTIRAFGEIGLDYDRLHHTPMEKQRLYFEMQLKLATEFDLPLFLHMRNALDDFLSILLPFIDGSRADGLVLKNKNVLVHSFTGTEQDLERILQQPSFFVSVNGCSLKTEENCAVAAKIPLDRLLIETDAPWCEIRRTHSSYNNLTKCPNEFYPFEYDIPQELLPKTTAKKGPKLVLNEFLPIPLVKFDKLASFLQSEESKKLVDPMVKSRNEPCLVDDVVVGRYVRGGKKLLDKHWRPAKLALESTVFVAFVSASHTKTASTRLFVVACVLEFRFDVHLVEIHGQVVRRHELVNVVYAVSYLGVPLLQSLAVQKSNNAHTHVVAADSRTTRTGSQTRIHHRLTDFRQRLLEFDATSYKIDHLLRCQTIPYSVTGKNNELVIFCSLMNHNVRICGHHLFLSRQMRRLLEFEISNSSGQRQVPVDTPQIDVSSGSNNSSLLSFISWLVVKRQRFALAVDAHDRSRVSSIAAINLIFGNNHASCSTS
ncbi:hypothetical protein OGATHE_004148 [Ogataea polymorpha]|uniref:Uncharacterized protein n=1 Tax=Ogataea polymorpha TaxID=460523 RepID=A0A9P8P4Y2_9ASCO|nr:hypothetical protein OGATHE_004148 [Ogataea polymorpha]